MTADRGGDKDIEKHFRRKNAVGNMLVRKFSFAPLEAKFNWSSHIVEMCLALLDALQLFGIQTTRWRSMVV